MISFSVVVSSVSAIYLLESPQVSMGFTSAIIKSSSSSSLISGSNLVSHNLPPIRCYERINRHVVTRNAVNLKNNGDGENDTVLATLQTSLAEKIGKVEEERLAFPELVSGEVPRVFSNLSYEKKEVDGKLVSAAVHSTGSTLGAAALVAGTTIGAGVLALPAAAEPAGFLPSSAGLFLAYIYMNISGLLIAELAINKIGETGKQGVGLLELYKSYLGKWSNVGVASYFFLHYTVMVAYISQGGANLSSFTEMSGSSILNVAPGIDRLVFSLSVGSLVYFCKESTVSAVNNILVLGVILSFVAILGIGTPTTDFQALLALENQHPDKVVDAFPILFLSLVYHNIVPTLVTQLECDREKITKAIIGGTTIPLIMFLSWNAIIIGNVIGMGVVDDSNLDPISLLQNEGIGGQTLSNIVAIFSELAVITSLIGFIYGLLDGLTDLSGLPTKGVAFDKWKPVLYAGVFLPPLIFSGNAEIFYEALDYGGAFGVSTLFLVLPPVMVWKLRYGERQTPLSAPPMVPFGKISLASLWKVAGTLIIEQGADKLGVFDFLREKFAFTNGI